MAHPLSDELKQKASGESTLAFDPLGRDEQQLTNIPTDQVEADPNQPRNEIGDVSELAASIREHGIINPIIVEAIARQHYRILSGERRYRASLEAGLTTIPCIVRTVEEHNRLAFQLIENLHRKDLNPLEEAKSYRRLMDEFKLGQRELAQRLGKSLGSINQTLRLLDLADSVQAELVHTSEQVSKSVLLEVAKEQDPEKQNLLWEQAKNGQMTVRKARSSKKPTATPPPQTKPKQAYSTNHDATVVIQSKTDTLSTQQIVAALEEALSIAKEARDS